MHKNLKLRTGLRAGSIISITIEVGRSGGGAQAEQRRVILSPRSGLERGFLG